MQAIGGPALTTVVILGIAGGYGFLLLIRAHDGVSFCLKMVTLCSGLLAIMMCLLCHFVDPGTPEPDPSDPPPSDEFDDALRIRERFLPDGRAWKQKWCRRCGVWRPHRCGHCHHCGRCVLRLDHHCYWMGTCVGERNMRFFVAFHLSAGTGFLALGALCLHRVATLGCWDRPENWVRTWEPLCLILVFCCCPPMMTMCVGTAMMPFAGIGYLCVILFDLEPHRFGSADPWALLGEGCRALRRCSGPRTYCLAPLARKTVVHERHLPPRTASIESPCPAPPVTCEESPGPRPPSPASVLPTEAASLPGSLADLETSSRVEGL